MKKKYILIISIAILTVLAVMTCVACVNATPEDDQNSGDVQNSGEINSGEVRYPDPDKLQKTLQDKGYYVDHYVANANADDGTVYVLYSFKESDNSSDGPELIIYWYDSEANAKSAFEEYSKDYTDDDAYVVKRFDKAVAIGLKAVVALI